MGPPASQASGSDALDAGAGTPAPTEVTVEPAELELEGLPVRAGNAPSEDKPGRVVAVEGVMDGGATDMSADLTVTPAGDEVTAAGTTATIDARTEVHPPRVGQLGTAVENEVVLPITPRGGSDDTDPATDDGADGPSSFTSGFSDRF